MKTLLYYPYAISRCIYREIIYRYIIAKLFQNRYLDHQNEIQNEHQDEHQNKHQDKHQDGHQNEHQDGHQDEHQCSSPETLEEAARGCILGAFIGDAAGAVLEFYSKRINQNDVDHALTFPGGGIFSVESGQFTDDSEMAMCLMHGLIDGKGTLNQQLIAKWYLQWYKSPPFDIGNTTRCAMK